MTHRRERVRFPHERLHRVGPGVVPAAREVLAFCAVQVRRAKRTLKVGVRKRGPIALEPGVLAEVVREVEPPGRGEDVLEVDERHRRRRGRYDGRAGRVPRLRDEERLARIRRGALPLELVDFNLELFQAHRDARLIVRERDLHVRLLCLELPRYRVFEPGPDPREQRGSRRSLLRRPRRAAAAAAAARLLLLSLRVEPARRALHAMEPRHLARDRRGDDRVRHLPRRQRSDVRQVRLRAAVDERPQTLRAEPRGGDLFERFVLRRPRERLQEPRRGVAEDAQHHGRVRRVRLPVSGQLLRVVLLPLQRRREPQRVGHAARHRRQRHVEDVVPSVRRPRRDQRAQERQRVAREHLLIVRVVRVVRRERELRVRDEGGVGSVRVRVGGRGAIAREVIERALERRRRVRVGELDGAIALHPFAALLLFARRRRHSRARARPLRGVARAGEKRGGATDRYS
eukprot:30018-Pelagococcus_subviridis.AAC.1